jgi:carboxypeptidase family protein
MKSSLRWLGLLAVVCAPAAVLGQDTGSLTGTITDNTGAVLAGVEIKVTSTGGGVTQTTGTNSDGNYLVAGLPGGTYDLTASAKGFTAFKASSIALRVGQKLRVDATLAVGSTSTTVEVQGETVGQVETQTSELGATVTGKQISQLQLNGRNYTQLVALAPGATNQSGSDEPGTGASTVAYSINGGRTEYNNWEVDGGNNLDDGSNTTMITYPSLDSIAEFRVLSSNYGAQYGRNGSGTVEVETKSGTNTFHGDVYYFNRNDALNARNYFESTVPVYKKHDYGYTIGGPVFIPGHYNQDKSKTFFFWSHEWRKDLVPGQVFNVAVPSLAERGCTSATPGCGGTVGDFSELCPGVDCPINPATGSTFNGPLGPNRVPIDPNALPLLAMFPLPNSGGPGSWTFNSSPAQATNWREELVRADQNINSKLRATVRYIHDSWNQVTPSPLWTNGNSYPTIQDAFVQPSASLVARLTAAASPTLLNEFVFSYSVNHLSFQNLGAWKRPAGYNLGLFNNGFGGGKLPGIMLNGGTAFNGLAQDAGYVPNGIVNSNPVYTYRDNVTKIVGKHNLQLGGYFVASQKNELPQFEPSVNGFLTFDTNLSGSTKNPFADLLSGNISSIQQASAQPKYYLRYKIFEPYFQDDWHATSRLTLNMGLRISLYGTSRDIKHQAYNFDPTAYNRAQAVMVDDAFGTVTGTANALIPGSGNPFDGIVQCGGPGGPFPVPGFPSASAGGTSHPGCVSGHLFNPAPRVGFAYDPKGNGRTAIRGGYGIFFEHTNGNEAVATALEGSVPFVLNPIQNNIPTTFDTNGNIVSSGYAGVGGSLGLQFAQSLVSIPQKQVWPYVQQWHMDVQQELPGHVVGVISYVGSKGTHLGSRLDLNQLSSVPLSQNPYKPGEPIGGAVVVDPNTGIASSQHDDCGTGMTPSGVSIPGFNPGGLPTPGTPGVNLFIACGNSADPFRPFLGYSDIRRQQNTASSIYHALQLSARKTFGALQFGAAYTYSHSIDDASSGGDTSFVDSYNFALNRASSNFDQRHVFSLSYIYDLPFFKDSGLAHTLLGGWQVSGIVSIQTGTPFSVTNAGQGENSSDSAGVGNGTGTGSHPDLIGNPNSGGPGGTVSSFGPLLFNPGAFAAPRGLTFGDAGRNIVRNPRTSNADMALFKHFPIKERALFEFRAEAFNVFNHTQFGYIGGDSGSAASNSSINAGNNSIGCYVGPNNTPNDPSCLTVGLLRPNGAHNPRILQLGLKFIF